MYLKYENVFKKTTIFEWNVVSESILCLFIFKESTFHHVRLIFLSQKTVFLMQTTVS